MPIFQRRPIERIDPVQSRAPIPGLPSRGPALESGVTAGTGPLTPWSSPAGIVERATALLAAERPGSTGGIDARSGSGSVVPAPDVHVSQIREQANEFIGRLSPLAGERPNLVAGMSPVAGVPGLEQPSDAAGPIVEPAPVLSPSGPVAPGGTARTEISLVNEDEQSARIVFFSTGLVGEDGASIPADCVSFEPRELTLSPGTSGDVMVRVIIPAHTRCGVYSGLIRASQLDHLHAVLVVHVERP
jgi:hypothetical protein